MPEADVENWPSYRNFPPPTAHPKVFPTPCSDTCPMGPSDVVRGSVGNSYRMGSFLG